MKRLFYILMPAILITTVSTMFTSCVRTVLPDNPKGLKGNFRHTTLAKKNYKKLKDYYLVLYPVGNTKTIIWNKDASINLSLKNFAGKQVRIDEWYMQTPDNVILYYRPFNLRVKKFIAKNWTKVTPEMKGEKLRFELVLMPKTSVLISKKLDFLKDIKLKSGESKKFLMVAELNLKSVNVRSSMFSIELKRK
jgi:hypothetical protein